jgi:hypothetical protein
MNTGKSTGKKLAWIKSNQIKSKNTNIYSFTLVNKKFCPLSTQHLLPVTSFQAQPTARLSKLPSHIKVTFDSHNEFRRQNFTQGRQSSNNNQQIHHMIPSSSSSSTRVPWQEDQALNVLHHVK